MMRKYEQRKILELLNTLHEAHDVLRKQSAPGTIINLLADCQDFALRIKEYIEEVEGKDSKTETAELLEEYCKIAFQVSQDAMEIKALQRQLHKIQSCVKSELKPNRMEIVFFPYQLSMFDSFESVYFAAKSDPDCDVYCVPIPWMSRTSEGDVDEIYYDGDQYPQEVEITDWRKYDVEARHPDVIFIHNPYENNNYVTSIHPDYYGSKLKEKTDCLVYIDYGLPVWMAKLPVDEGLIPVHMLCDIFIAYSKEYVEQIQFLLRNAVFAGVLSKETIDQNCIVALGSPKFDAVVQARREQFVMPDRWQKLIKGKKIMLFSTSIGAILQGDENFLIKTRATLDLFRGRGDMVLWWRPHPLSESTYASMRPQFLEQYKNIVKEYTEDGWGIYDDTPDLHRAIAWSDGCYTDESSLLLLYLATGKPFTVRTFSYAPEKHDEDNSSDFTPILESRIKNMQAARGGNVADFNCVIWWHNFVDADFIKNVQYDNFLERFVDFILNEANYPDAKLYRELKLQMLHDSVENTDGTAGPKIYDFVKQKILGVKLP